jgi:hypothetical protein
VSYKLNVEPQTQAGAKVLREMICTKNISPLADKNISLIFLRSSLHNVYTAGEQSQVPPPHNASVGNRCEIVVKTHFSRRQQIAHSANEKRAQTQNR